MALRFLHTSDVHLGRAFSYLGERAPDHQERLKRAFERVYRIAHQYECQAILNAGDLFDSPRVSRGWVEFALTIVSSVSIPTVLIPGNHDPIEHHPLKEFSLPSQLHFLTEPKRTRMLPLDLEIVAIPAGLERYAGGLLQRNPAGVPYQVGLLHGSMPSAGGAGTLDPALIAQSQLDYVALGDWHSPQDFTTGSVVCWYSGAPEMIMPNQRLPAVVLIVELEQGNPPRVQAVPSGEAVYPEGTNGTLELDITAWDDPFELLESVKARLTPNTVARLRLVGQWRGKTPLNIYDFAENLRKSCLWLELESAFLSEAMSPETPFEHMLAKVAQERTEASPNESALIDEAYQLALYLLRGGRL